MEEQRKHAVLFAATLLCARKLTKANLEQSFQCLLRFFFRHFAKGSFRCTQKSH